MDTIINAFRKFTANIVFGKIFYLGDNDCFLVQGKQNSRVGADYGERVHVLILAKKYYFETVQVFPTDNLKDIRALVTLDMAAYAPFVSDLFFLRKGDGKKVNMWVVHPDVVSRIEKLSPLLILPETALLGALAGEKTAMYHIQRTPSSHLLVSVEQGRGVVSIEEPDPDVHLFRRSLGGVFSDTVVQSISGMDDYLRRLHAALTGEMPGGKAAAADRLFLRSLRPFVNPAAFFRKVEKKKLIAAFLPLVLLFGIYFGGSFLLPYLTHTKLQAENEALNSSLSVLLEKQDKLVQHLRDQEAFADKMNTYTYKVPLLTMIRELVVSESTTLTQLVVSGHVVEMRGKAFNATALLAGLAEKEGVGSAGFVSPLREDKKTGMKVFAITFIYEQKI